MRLVDSSIQQRMKEAEEKQAQAARVTQRRQTIFTLIVIVVPLVAGFSRLLAQSLQRRIW
jgi:cation transport ATPase